MKMKKLITFVMTAVCMTFMSVLTANAADKPILGDSNGDGYVNSSDASTILGYYSEISTGKLHELGDEIIGAADVNGDGKVDSTDGSFVLEYYAYTSTLPQDEPAKDMRDFLELPEKNPPETKPTTSTAAVTTTAFESTATTVTTTEIVNIVLAPKGLDPGKKGSIEYIVNTAELKPHDDIPLYNIKGDNKNGGKPYLSHTYYLTDDTKIILNNFAKEHFTDEMTNYDRLKYTWNWLHFNVDYASSWEAYSKISELSFSEACFVHKSGQCIQYNGAFAEMMAYMGYDVYLLEKWNRPNFTVQHFMSEVNIGGVGYNTEVGERSYDSPPFYYWMWLFDSSKQQFFGIEEQSVSEEIKGEK